MTLPFDQTYMSHPHQFFAQMYTAQHHPQQQPLIPLPAPHQHPHAHPQAQDPSFAGEASSSSAGGVERKRPKYTRSKTGCMTCRHKKIKCDERKPVCSRCSHGQRECTWPEGLPKKKAAEAKRKRNTSEEGDEDTTRRSDSPPSTAGGNPPSDGAAAFNGLLSPTSPRHPYTASSYATGNAAAVAAAANYGTYRQPLPSPQYPPTPISGGSHFSSAAGFPPTPVSAQFRGGAAGAAAAAANAATRGSRSGSASGLSAFDPSLLALPSLSTASPYSSSNHTPNASYTGSPNPSEDYHSGGEASGSYSSDTAYSSGASAGGAGSGGPGGGAVEKFYLPGEKLYYTGEKEKHWNANGGSTMFTSPDPIEPYFRTVQERNLIRHFCHNSAAIIMAIPPTSSAISAYNTTPFNRPLNPLLAVNLPLVLDRVPGQDAATEALRVALMGVGAVHQAYLLSRSSFTPSDQAGGIMGGMGALGLIPRVAGLRPVTTVVQDKASPPGSDEVAAASSPASSDGGPGPLTTAVQPIPKGGGGIQNLTTHARDLLNVALGLRLAASRKLHEACQSMRGTLSDAALGASLTIALIDIFSGGHHWNGNITLAKTLVMLRGGPKALLSTPAAPNKFTGGAGEKVQPARLWLEILAVYETFGSLTSGEVPSLIGPGQNDWWFDTSGMSTYHRYSVEQVFGMSRSMIAVVATVSAFLCRTIRERAIISPDYVPDIPIPTLDLGLGDLDPLLDDSALEGIDLSMLEPETGPNDAIDLDLLTAVSDEDAAAIESLSGVVLDSNTLPQANPNDMPLPPVTADLGAHPPITEILTPQAQFIADARELYLNVYTYTPLPFETPLPIPGLDARVRSGNETHRLAMCIILLRDVFRVPRVDDRVQSFSRRILDICLTNTNVELGVDLTWPVIVGGSQVTGHDRQRVLETFDAYRRQCCFEIDSSEQIVTEVWRRVDAGLPRPDWRAVVEDLNLRILVL